MLEDLKKISDLSSIENKKKPKDKAKIHILFILKYYLKSIKVSNINFLHPFLTLKYRVLEKHF